jgi:hypothetical protein
MRLAPDSPVIQYMLTRIAQFRPDAHKVSIPAIHDCDAALNEGMTIAVRLAAMERAVRAMTEYESR